MTSDVESRACWPFVCLWRTVHWSFAHFLIGLFDFIVVDFEEFSVYFICESFIRHLNYKYSLPFFGLPSNIVESVL